MTDSAKPAGVEELMRLAKEYGYRMETDDDYEAKAALEIALTELVIRCDSAEAKLHELKERLKDIEKEGL